MRTSLQVPRGYRRISPSRARKGDLYVGGSLWVDSYDGSHWHTEHTEVGVGLYLRKVTVPARRKVDTSTQPSPRPFPFHEC